MAGKRIIISLLAVLLAFGYLFWLNPDKVNFQLLPGAGHAFETSFALVCSLFFVTSFGLALFAYAFKEAWVSLGYYLHRKKDERIEEAGRLMDRARGLMVMGKTGTSRKLLKRAHAKDPGRPRITLELARAEMEEGKFKNALERVKLLMANEPRNPEALALRLELYRRLDDFEGQVATLRSRLELDPGHMPTLRMLCDLYEHVANFGEAARVSETILNKASSREERAKEHARFVKLKLAHALSLEPSKAAAALETLVRREDYAPAYAELANIYMKLSDRTRAEQSLIEGFKSTGQPGLLEMLERLYVEENRAEEMLKLYKKQQRRTPAVALLRAKLLMALARYEEAAETIESADRQVAAAPSGRALLGEAYYKLQRFEKAASAYRGGHGGAPAAKMKYICAKCHAESANWQAACPQCKTGDALALELGMP